MRNARKNPNPCVGTADSAPARKYCQGAAHQSIQNVFLLRPLLPGFTRNRLMRLNAVHGVASLHLRAEYEMLSLGLGQGTV